jgi:septal ring factor EnvC (AmiA/AmiB activator)
VNKKLILIALGAGLVIFLAMVASVYFLTPKPAPEVVLDPSQAAAPQVSVAGEPAMPNAESLLSGGDVARRNITETQLKSLIFEARDNIKAYKIKLQELQTREQRLQIAQGILRQDIEELNKLRIELASAVTTLKNERDKLEESLIKIEQNEIANLQQLSAAYDKMDATAAGKILINMSQSQSQKYSSSNDAIKILYYMTERVKAEVLASIAETQPEISAYYCSELKQVVVKE